MTPTLYLGLPEEPVGAFSYAQGVRAGELVFVAGQLAQDNAGWSARPGDIVAETHAAMVRIGRVLVQAGCGFGDIVRVGVFLTDIDDFEAMNAAYRSYFKTEHLPARTTVGVARLLFGASIEIDCIARVPALG